MTLYEIIGDVGKGKSLFMAYVAEQSPNENVYSNFNIKLPNVKPINVYSVGEVENGIVLLDEMWDWLESRLSGNELNLYLSRILFKSRHKGLDIYGSAQLGSTLDKRFRDMANYSSNIRIFCLGLSKDKSGYIYIINESSFFLLTIEKAEQIYNIYNSWDKEQDTIHKTLFDATKINPTIDEYAKIIIKKYRKNKVKITKGLVTDIFLTNKWDLSLQALTYYRIQSMKASS